MEDWGDKVCRENFFATNRDYDEKFHNRTSTDLETFDVPVNKVLVLENTNNTSDSVPDGSNDGTVESVHLVSDISIDDYVIISYNKLFQAKLLKRIYTHTLKTNTKYVAWPEKEKVGCGHRTLMRSIMNEETLWKKFRKTVLKA